MFKHFDGEFTGWHTKQGNPVYAGDVFWADGPTFVIVDYRHGAFGFIDGDNGLFDELEKWDKHYVNPKKKIIKLVRKGSIFNRDAMWDYKCEYKKRRSI
jgi:hypothetical protein